MKKLSKKTSNKSNKSNKHIIIIIIGAIVLICIIIGITLLLRNNDDCKWCDNTNTECYLDSDGKTKCIILDN